MYFAKPHYITQYLTKWKFIKAGSRYALFTLYRTAKSVWLPMLFEMLFIYLYFPNNFFSFLTSSASLWFPSLLHMPSPSHFQLCFIEYMLILVHSLSAVARRQIFLSRNNEVYLWNIACKIFFSWDAFKTLLMALNSSSTISQV